MRVILVRGLLTLLHAPTLWAQARVVSIPDMNLEAVIRETIAKPTGDILDTDMAELTTLYASDRGIADLTGLEHAVNLTWLELGINQISGVSPLSGLSSLTLLGATAWRRPRRASSG